jgi:hypothetical protein
MAKRLEQFPASTKGGRIAEDRWFDGSVWKLSPEEVNAYQDINTCRSALFQLARRRGWKGIKTRILRTEEEGVGLVFQCRNIDADFWAASRESKKTLNPSLWESCEMKVHEFNPTKELADASMVKDTCNLFDEMSEEGNLFLGPEDFLDDSKEEAIRNNHVITDIDKLDV